MKLSQKIYLTYDDIQIIPKYSIIESRDWCTVSTRITKLRTIKIPICSSPMDTVTEGKMAHRIGELGGIGFIHRFMSIEDQCKEVEVACQPFNNEPNNIWIGAAVGVKDYQERVPQLIDSGVDIIMIDVAHGHHILVQKAIKEIRKIIGSHEVEIIAGNVSTREAAKDLCDWGVDGLRVGIGGGSLCETRIRTGVGVPQVNAIIDCCEAAKEYKVPIMADGGIRYTGDVAKAIACGADCIMLGSLLSGTKETPGMVIKQGVWPNEQLYKKYQGSASLDSKIQRHEGERNVEGNSRLIPYKGKCERIINDIVDGLKSAMSYVGAGRIEEFKEKSELIQVTQAGITEAFPHLLLVKN